jgi:hypothetical protein
LSRHPIDVLRAALQEAKTEAATLRIKTTTLAQKRNAAILERNEARRERDAALSEGRGLLAQRQTWRGIAMQHEGALRALEKRFSRLSLLAWDVLQCADTKWSGEDWTPAIGALDDFLAKDRDPPPVDGTALPPAASQARIRELEAEVQRLQQDRAQVGAFGFKPLGIR